MKDLILIKRLWILLVLYLAGSYAAMGQNPLSRESMSAYTKDKALYMQNKELTVGPETTGSNTGTKSSLMGTWVKIKGEAPSAQNMFRVFKIRMDYDRFARLRSALYYWEEGDKLRFKFMLTSGEGGTHRFDEGHSFSAPNGTSGKGNNGTDEPPITDYFDYSIDMSSCKYESENWNYISVGYAVHEFIIAVNGKVVKKLTTDKLTHYKFHNHHFYDITYGDNAFEYYLDDITLFVTAENQYGLSNDKQYYANAYNPVNTTDLYQKCAGDVYKHDDIEALIPSNEKVLYCDFEDGIKNKAKLSTSGYAYADLTRVIEKISSDLSSSLISRIPIKNYYEKTPVVRLDTLEGCKLRLWVDSATTEGHYDVRKIKYKAIGAGDNQSKTLLKDENTGGYYFDLDVADIKPNFLYFFYDETNHNPNPISGKILYNPRLYLGNSSYKVSVDNCSNNVDIYIKLDKPICPPIIKIKRNDQTIYTRNTSDFNKEIEFRYSDKPPTGHNYTYKVTSTINGIETDLPPNGSNSVNLSANNIQISNFTHEVFLNEKSGKPNVKLKWSMLGSGIDNTNFSIKKNDSDLPGDIENVGNNYTMIDDARLTVDQTYSYALSYGTCSNPKTQTVKLLSGIPDEEFPVSRDESKPETAHLLWQKPEFDNKTSPLRFLQTSGFKSVSVPWNADFEQSYAAKYSASVLCRYPTDGNLNLFSLKALGITMVTYIKLSKQIYIKFKDADGSTSSVTLDYDLTATKGGQPYPGWNLFTFVYNTDKLSVYINNNKIWSGYLYNMIVKDNNFFNTAVSNPLDISYMAIWKSALKPDAITKLAGKASPADITPQPVMYYNFGSIDGTTFTNQIINSYPNATTSNITGDDIKSEIMNIDYYQFLGFNIYEGNTKVASIAKNADNGINYEYNHTKTTPCKEVTYQAAPLFAGGEGTRNAVSFTIVPKYAINNVDASDALFQSKVKIKWDETPGVEKYAIYRDNEKLAEVSKDDLQYKDASPIPGEYHKYVVQGISDCAKSEITDPNAADIGFVFPLGNISGTVKSPNGNPVMDAYLETDTVFGYSLKNATVKIPLDSLNEKVKFQKASAVSFWAKGEVRVTSRNATSNIDYKSVNTFTTTGKYQHNFYTPKGKPYGDVDRTIPADTGWVHYLFVNDGIKDRYYVNGKLVIARTLGATLVDAKTYSINAPYLDELSIWNDNPYSATFDKVNFMTFSEEGKYIYGDNSTQKAKFENTITRTLSGKEPGLIAYYRFDEGVAFAPNNKKTYNSAEWVFNNFAQNLPVNFTGTYTQNCPKLKNSAFTNNKGIYELSNINFNNVDGYLFGVKASKKTEALEHKMTPAYKDAKLNASTRNRDGIEFTDNSLFPVSGTVFYRRLLEDAKYLKGEIPLFNAEVLVDGKEQRPPAITNQQGEFTVEVEPGMHEFTVKPYERTVQANNTELSPDNATNTNDMNSNVSSASETETVIENFEVPETLGSRYQANVTADRKGFRLIVDDFNVWADLKFEDTASYSLEVYFHGRCNFKVGDYQVLLESTNGAFKYKTPVIKEAKYTISKLPPLEYKVTIISLNNLEIDPQTVDLQKGNSKIEFVYRAPLQMAVRNLNKPFNDKNTFDKARTHNGLPYTIGNDNSKLYIAKKGDKIKMYVDAFEMYNGKRCPIDSAKITIYNNLGGGGEIAVDTMYTPPAAGAASQWSDKELGIALAGDPNVAGDMLKDIQVAVTDNAGRDLTKKIDVFVIGSVMTEKTFATVPKTIPLMWLVDPPGDMSYSYIEAGEEVCNSVEFEIASEASLDISGWLNTAPDVKFMIGLGLIPGPEMGVEIETEAKKTLTGSTGGNYTTIVSHEVCASFSETIQTSDDANMVGPDADVFVGLGINYLFGEGKSTSFNWSNKTKNPVSASVVVSNDTIQTMYVYNRSTIKDQILENDRSLLAYYEDFKANGTNNGNNISKYNDVLNKMETMEIEKLESKLKQHKQSIETWSEIIGWFNYENDFQKKSADEDDNNFGNNWQDWNNDVDFILNNKFKNELAEFEIGDDLSLERHDLANYTADAEYLDVLHKNISFGYGSNYSANIGLTSSENLGINQGISFGAAVAAELDVKVSGIGAGGSVETVVSHTRATTWGSIKTKNTTVGVFLSDKDPGDIFSVSIFKDNKRGTLYFKTEGGQSMCPWEKGTQAREALSLSGLNSVDNIPFDQSAFVELKIQNKSETDEGGAYYIMQNLETNPSALKFNLNGADLTTSPLALNIPGNNGEITTTLQVSRTKSDIFDYKPVTFKVISQCEADRAVDPRINGEVTAMKEHSITFKWNQPCLSGLEIFEKNDSRIINNSETSKQIEPTFYLNPIRNELDNLTKMQLQISPETATEWTGVGQKITKDDISATDITEHAVRWNGGEFADGMYKIRMHIECKDGTTGYSNELPLRIARGRTVLLGSPQPVDNMLGNDDQIGAQFTNQIDCGYVDWKVIGNFPGARYQVFAQSLKFDGNDHIVLAEKAFTGDLGFMKNNDFMVTAWIKPTVTDKEQTIISMLKEGKGMSLGINTDNKMVFELKTTTGTHTAVSADAITINQWQFVYCKVSTGDGNKNLQVGINNVNGNVQGTMSETFDIGNTGKIILGQATTATNDSKSYTGYIDDVRIFGKDEKSGFNQANIKKKELISGGSIRKYWKLDDALSLDFPKAMQAHPEFTTDVPQWQSYVDDYTETLNTMVSFGCYGNEVAIVLPNDLHRRKQLENIQLEVVLNNLKDIYGNKSYESFRSHKDSTKIRWSFMVNRNSMKWEYPDIDIVKYTGEEKTFSMDLYNNGGETEEFDLLSLPTWLKAQPTSGTILPGGKKTVTFTVLPSANQGLYKDEVYAENNEGWEPLLINLHVICTQPQWEVEATDYDQSMIITSKLEGVTIDPTVIEEYSIAAYYGNTVVGKGNVMRTESGDYKTVLMVYDDSDITVTKNIEVHLWDPLNCKERVATNIIPFQANSSYTNTINFAKKAVKEYQLAEGWNWISCNLTSDPATSAAEIGRLNRIISSPNISAIRQLKHNNDYANYFNGFTGNLQTLSNRSGYLIKANSETIMRISGQEFDINQAEITLAKGWNLISYLPNGTQELSNVFSTPTDGEIVKSHTQYAIYTGGGWFGDLQYMEPGKAYYVKVASERKLKYTDVNYTKPPRKRGDANEPYWHYNANKYMSTMTITALVEHNGEKLLSSAYQVGAFVNGECRGVAQAVAAEKGITFFLTVHGDAADENIDFKLVELATGNIFNINEKYTSQPNGIYGYPTPVLLTTKANDENTGNESTTNIFDHNATANSKMLNIYPNPFNDELNIEFSVAQTQDISIELYTVQGKKVGTLYRGNAAANEKHTVTMNVGKETGRQLTTGVYMCVLRLEDGTLQSKQIIRK